MNLSMGLRVQFRGTALASMCETLSPISNAKNDTTKMTQDNQAGEKQRLHGWLVMKKSVQYIINKAQGD